MNRTLVDVFAKLSSVPTAPFREQWVASALAELLDEIPGLELATDRFGNRVARLRRGLPQGEPIVFVAHLDHPGFVPGEGRGSFRRLEGSEGFLYEAFFEGRVLDDFFPGSPVRLFRSADDPGIAGIVFEASGVSRASDNRRVVIKTEESAEGAVLGMWDLPGMEVREGAFHARACDDLMGCSAMVAALHALADADHIDVTMLFTRAEEAGFCGLLCLLGEEELPGLVPESSLFVSVEISGETDTMRLGDGAIIRVGDRSSTFDGPVTDRLAGLAAAGNIEARRALMDRGTCEATPLIRSGFRAGGICAPVRHYHNMDMETGRIVPESVAVSDAEALVDLVVGLVMATGSGKAAEPIVAQDYGLFMQKGTRLLANGTGTTRPVTAATRPVDGVKPCT